MEIRLTKADCENLCMAWADRKYEEVCEAVCNMNPLEAMKFSKHIMQFYSKDGGLVNQIINFATDQPVKRTMILRRDLAKDIDKLK